MKKKLLITLGIIILTLLLLYGYAHLLGTKGLIVKEIKITDRKIPNHFHGLKIAHLSDIHYGRIINEQNIENIVKKVNLLKPDIVVITGDLLDRDKKLTSNQHKILVDNLKKIEVTIGKYAISGNHDHAYGIEEWEKILKSSDFINLDDNYELIFNKGNIPILINGMSSNLHNQLKIDEKLRPFNTRSNEIDNPEKNKVKPAYNIMIMHEPDYIVNFEYNNFNLILAGHSHNGQVKIPFKGAIIVPIGAKKYYNEYYNLDNTKLYISSGLGTSVYDIRLFNKPSFNFYRLTNK